MRLKRSYRLDLDALETRLALTTFSFSLSLDLTSRMTIPHTPAQVSPTPASPNPKPTAPVSTPKVSTPAPAPAAMSVPMTFAPAAAATTPTVYEAFVNLGIGPYPEASLITSGNAEPWFDSTKIVALFGGHQVTAQQVNAFDGAVIQRVRQTFALSGINVSLTDDPAMTAPHTLSVVSNTTASLLPTAIGMTDIGGNGFSFIDQEAQYAQSLDQLEWIVAHNLSHELMLSFGVGENYDTTGNYIDARNANISMMISPSATFSPAAAAAINQALAEESN